MRSHRWEKRSPFSRPVRIFRRPRCWAGARPLPRRQEPRRWRPRCSRGRFWVPETLKRCGQRRTRCCEGIKPARRPERRLDSPTRDRNRDPSALGCDPGTRAGCTLCRPPSTFRISRRRCRTRGVRRRFWNDPIWKGSGTEGGKEGATTFVSDLPGRVQERRTVFFWQGDGFS